MLLEARRHSSPSPPAGINREKARRLAEALRRDRVELSRRLMENVSAWEKYARMIPTNRDALDRWVEDEFQVFVEYLDALLSTGDDTFKYLYIADKLKQFHDQSLTPEENDENRRRVMEADLGVFREFAWRELGLDAAAAIESSLGEIGAILTCSGRKELKALMIGDCLHIYVRGFLTPLALEDGISFEPMFLATKNPVEQRNELRRLAGERFDLVFYSPFTHVFSPEVAAFNRLRRVTAGRSQIRSAVSAAIDTVERNLDVLGALYECTTYIHNSRVVRQHDSTLKEIAKNLLTGRSRRIVRSEVNRRMAELVAARRGAEGRVVLVDEDELLGKHGDLALGRMAFNTTRQHPTVLMVRLLAAHYREILKVHADLVGKKVVVTDLDNTLWKGEIGEGSVEHFLGAQNTLKHLRRKGILLTVNSKNDPRNVRWDGAALNEDDFVNMQINWDSKVANMRRIQEALNLKLKDFVFVDDRADQRALVQDALPELHVLDATSPRAWKQLAIWAEALPDKPEVDRTRQYHERQQRENFIAAAAVEEDPVAMLAKLEIRIEIGGATASNLKRVTELINRTNQFNLAGSRISLKEIKAWYGTPGRRVVVVEAADKFGAMGLICAALLDLTGPEIRIPAFVLSCRVFGYGIEDAVLGAIKRLAASDPQRGRRPIRGDYQETFHNEPCRKMYPSNGFRWDGGSWLLSNPEPSQPPGWLTVADGLLA